MDEKDSDGILLREIQNIIRSKYWYSLGEGGAFNWVESTDNVAGMLGEKFRWYNPSAVRWAFESAFTQNSLTVVMTGDGEIPFIDALQSIGADLYVWTVGDESWQRKKFQNTGLKDYVEDERFVCAKSNKQKSLKALFTEIAEKQGNSHVYIVDDKSSNLELAMSLSEVAGNLGLHLHNYHLKLHEAQANPNACYRYLVEKLREHKLNGEKVTLVMDMDGVLIDTDRTLLDVGARNILDCYIKETRGQNHFE